MKLVLTNYRSTAEETEAASKVVLDAFTNSLMKLRCHNCTYTAKFQMHKLFYKINGLHIFFKQINVEKMQ